MDDAIFIIQENLTRFIDGDLDTFLPRHIKTNEIRTVAEYYRDIALNELLHELRLSNNVQEILNTHIRNVICRVKGEDGIHFMQLLSLILCSTIHNESLPLIQVKRDKIHAALVTTLMLASSVQGNWFDWLMGGSENYVKTFSQHFIHFPSSTTNNTLFFSQLGGNPTYFVFRSGSSVTDGVKPLLVRLLREDDKVGIIQELDTYMKEIGDSAIIVSDSFDEQLTKQYSNLSISELISKLQEDGVWFMKGKDVDDVRKIMDIDLGIANSITDFYVDPASCVFKGMNEKEHAWINSYECPLELGTETFIATLQTTTDVHGMPESSQLIVDEQGRDTFKNYLDKFPRTKVHVDEDVLYRTPITELYRQYRLIDQYDHLTEEAEKVLTHLASVFASHNSTAYETAISMKVKNIKERMSQLDNLDELSYVESLLWVDKAIREVSQKKNEYQQMNETFESHIQNNIWTTIKEIHLIKQYRKYRHIDIKHDRPEPFETRIEELVASEAACVQASNKVLQISLVGLDIQPRAPTGDYNEVLKAVNKILAHFRDNYEPYFEKADLISELDVAKERVLNNLKETFLAVKTHFENADGEFNANPYEFTLNELMSKLKNNVDAYEMLKADIKNREKIDKILSDYLHALTNTLMKKNSTDPEIERIVKNTEVVYTIVAGNKSSGTSMRAATDWEIRIELSQIYELFDRTTASTATISRDEFIRFLKSMPKFLRPRALLPVNAMYQSGSALLLLSMLFTYVVRYSNRSKSAIDILSSPVESAPVTLNNISSRLKILFLVMKQMQARKIFREFPLRKRHEKLYDSLNKLIKEKLVSDKKLNVKLRYEPEEKVFTEDEKIEILTLACMCGLHYYYFSFAIETNRGILKEISDIISLENIKSRFGTLHEEYFMREINTMRYVLPYYFHTEFKITTAPYIPISIFTPEGIREIYVIVEDKKTIENKEYRNKESVIKEVDFVRYFDYFVNMLDSSYFVRNFGTFEFNYTVDKTIINNNKYSDRHSEMELNKRLNTASQPTVESSVNITSPITDQSPPTPISEEPVVEDSEDEDLLDFLRKRDAIRDNRYT